MDDIHQFLDLQLALLERAQQEEIDSLDQAIHRLSPTILQTRGLACTNLQVSGCHTGLGGKSIIDLESDVSKELPINGIRTGDIIKVEEQVASSTKRAVKNDIVARGITGVVVKAGDRKISVALDKHDEELDFSKRLWIMKYYNKAPFKRMIRAISDLKAMNLEHLSSVTEICLGLNKHAPSDEPSIALDYLNPELNQSQKEAVAFALGTTNVALIHGPPGTGKTHTLIEIIRQLASSGSKVLVCGPSNISVDNIVERLTHFKIPMVRLGHPARLLPAILSNSLDIILQSSDTGLLVKDIRKEIDKKLIDLKKMRNKRDRKLIWEDVRSLRKECKSREKRSIQDVLKASQVVFCTLHGAGGSHVQETKFDVVIIDEASQALEAQSWIPLIKASKCILAGDHLQLPPIVKATKTDPSTDLCKLEVSLFQRLLDLHGPNIKRQLVIQYRMHETIMQFPSRALYESSLIAASSVQSHLLLDLPGVMETEETLEPLVFWDTQGGDFRENMVENTTNSQTKANPFHEESKSNYMEAAICNMHLRKLISAGVNPGDVAVITPYNAQVVILSEMFKFDFPEVEIGSVDGFQGREKEVVILSLVRSNEKGEVGFLADKRRLNVAMTRPKRHLCVVGDSETLSSGGSFLREWMGFLEEHAELRYPDISTLGYLGSK